MIFIQGTTIQISYELDFGVEAIKNSVISLKQGCVKVEKYFNDCSIDGNTIIASFSQQETLLFSEGIAEVELKVLFHDGKASATETSTIFVKPTLYKEILS